MRRALVVSYHFSPDRSVGAKRPTELVNSMVEAGWKVTVLTTKRDSLPSPGESHWSDCVEIIQAPHLPGVLNPAYAYLKRFVQSLRGEEKQVEQPLRKGKCEAPEERKANEAYPITFLLKRMIISGQATLNATKGWLLASVVLLIYQKIKGKRFDIVISSSPPASVHFLARFAVILFRSKWIMDVRDPINMWDLVKPVCRAPYRIAFENWLEKRYLLRADEVVVTTDALRDEMSKLAKSQDYKYRVNTIYNGFDGEFVENTASLDNGLELAFAGELYANRNPFPLLNAIKSLLECGEIKEGGIRFNLFGNCETWNGHSLRDWAKENKLEGVVILHGMLAPKDLEMELSRANLLVSYAQQQPLQIPAKTFDYLRYPCKSLVITEDTSSTGRLVTENGFGYASEDNPSDLKETLLLAMNDLTRRGSGSLSQEEVRKRQEFSRAAQNRVYIALIESLSE